MAGGRRPGPRCMSEVTLVRGWSGHPYAMVQEIDQSFDAVAMIGYHGPASDPQNPLSHTYSGSWNHITLNGSLCPEYWLYAHCAALEGVPVVFVSGDAGICKPHDHFGSGLHSRVLKKWAGPKPKRRTQRT